MIFQHTIDDVLSGRKTQTRRLVKLGEIYHWKAINSRGNVVSASAYHYDPHDQHHQRTLVPGTIEITRVSQKPRHGNPEWRKRLKWKVGKIYAVQPGVGKKQVGRIRITGIRQEHLQDITEEDAIAEGAKTGYFETPGGPYSWWESIDPIEDYARIWQSTHTKPGTRWEDNPLVWVLDFELVTDD